MAAFATPRLTAMLGLNETEAEVYGLLDWRRAVRLGGVLWVIGGTSAAVMVLFESPTHVIGQAGWVLAFSVYGLGLLAGWYLITRPGAVGPRLLLAMGYVGALAVGIGQLLLGTRVHFGMILLLLAAYQLSVHPPRRGLPLLAWVIAINVASTLAGQPDRPEVVQLVTGVVLIVLLSAMSLVNAHNYRHVAAALVAERARAEELSLTDPLTGLGNRRAFDRTLAREFALSERNGRPLSLVMLDADGFKAINDTHGHDAGDAALVAIARAVTAEVRLPDSCFRWGGDEFTLVLPETPRAGAELVAARISRAVHAARLAGGIRLGITAGVQECQPGTEPADLVSAADGALLAAKQQ